LTRHFEPQENMLTFADLEALWTCLSEVDGIAFFNCGRASGASQPHRHLQLVPLPMSEAPDPYPFAPLFAAGSGSDIAQIPELPFRHAVMRIRYQSGDTPQTLAERTQAEYGLLLDAVGLAPIDLDQAVRASGSYNLLLTRHWMMIVPRSRECFGTVSVNALAFVGSLFAKRREELDRVLEYGPLAVLSDVALPP
jgi:ATP adenylyltransferase